MAPEPRHKALVADDDPGVRETIAEYLTMRGFEVLQAPNGLEALLQVKRGAPKVVVIDLQMPRLGGLEAIPRIRAFDPSIVIVVVTGEADARLHEQARKRGASAVLAKPIVLTELAAAVATPERPAPERAVPSSAAPSTTGGRGEILIVDDDAGVSDVLRDVLTARGHQTRVVGDAAAALRAVVAHAPDIVLLDINMPGLTGVDALPALRAVAPRTAVIMVSGTVDSEVAKRSLAYGAFDYVTKPIDAAYLVQSIDTALRLRSLDS